MSDAFAEGSAARNAACGFVGIGFVAAAAAVVVMMPVVVIVAVVVAVVGMVVAVRGAVGEIVRAVNRKSNFRASR